MDDSCEHMRYIMCIKMLWYCFLTYKFSFNPFTADWGFPGGTSDKEPASQCKRPQRRRLNPWVRKVPWKGHCKKRAFQSTPVERSMDRRAWRTTVHGVTKRWTWLKWLGMVLKKQFFTVGVPRLCIFTFACTEI